MSIFDTEGAVSASSTPSPELIKAIGTRFISRKDVKAEQDKKGAWHPVVQDPRDPSSPYVPFSLKDFNDHLTGTRTLGHYVLGTDNTAKFFCFDLDLDPEGFYILDEDPDGDPDDPAEVIAKAVRCNPREEWLNTENPQAQAYFTRTLRTLAEGLAYRATRLHPGLHVAIANSGGKGLHVYGFMSKPEPATDVRWVARTILEDVPNQFAPVRGDAFWKHKTTGAFSNITIEVFPKQDTLSEDGLGNLIRLPLGINRKTGNRGYFVNCKSGYNKLPEMDALRALSGDLPWE